MPESSPNGLLKEISQTKERLAAWAFRLLIALVGATGSAMLWMGYDALNKVEAQVSKQGEVVWTSIQDAQQQQAATAQKVEVLTQVVKDSTDRQTQINNDLKMIVQDHEQRLRSIERQH